MPAIVSQIYLPDTHQDQRLDSNFALNASINMWHPIQLLGQLEYSLPCRNILTVLPTFKKKEAI